MNTVKVLLFLAANFDWQLEQFDVKNTFLYGDFQEKIYIKVSLGFTKDVRANKMCRLKKELYKFKQSPVA